MEHRQQAAGMAEQDRMLNRKQEAERARHRESQTQKERKQPRNDMNL